MEQGNNNGQKPEEPYSHPNLATDQALDWFLRLQDDNGDPATQAEFNQWIEGGPQRREAFERLQRLHAMPSLRRATQRDVARLDATEVSRPALEIRPSAARLRPRSGSRSLSWTWGIAAAAAVLVAVTVMQGPSLFLRWQSDYLTEAGELRRIRLPDGSEMVLNTASAVALDFDGGRRQVKLLAGEAFFDVRSRAGQSFIVAGSYADIEVKGTAFAVRVNDSRDTVVLERGLVDVRRQMDRLDNVVLKPGEMITAGAAQMSAVTAVDVNASLAWLGGRIVFREQPFDKALAELRRYYSGSVILGTGRFSGKIISGNYSVADPGAAIRTLAESVGASVMSLPGGIILLR